MNDAPHADDRTLVLAFYVVVDVSVSMEQNGALVQANEIMPKVADAIDTSPTLGDLVRFGAMDFSDDARVVLRLGDLRDVHAALPTFQVMFQYASGQESGAFRMGSNGPWRSR